MTAPVINHTSLVAITVVLESLLLLVATIWSRAAGLDLLPHLHFDAVAAALGVVTAFGTVGLSLVFYRLGDSLAFFKQLKQLSDEILLPAVSGFTMTDIVLVSLASGICEEILFRGVMLPLWGLAASSIIFGFVHSPTLKYFPYVVVSILAGLLFGYLYLYSGSLWLPVIAHVMHNLISLIIIRKRKPTQT
jgi:uncharacterized protein